MTTPMIAGRTLGLVPVAARLDGRETRGITYPGRRDPDHAIAYAEVAGQRSDYAEVTYPDGAALSFRAWRMSRETFAWQSSAMGSPAMMPYMVIPAGHVLAGGAVVPLPAPTADPFATHVYGMPRAEWDAYGGAG